ncbi:FAD-binding oxidoreductase [Patescibacteria group bacterium]|nr:FAD-binding oxidoreductase [Patescibacteria group bacterium]
MLNLSPWLETLNRHRGVHRLSLYEKPNTNIAIVGGGIAGVATAAAILEKTQARVLLVEADLVAHAATGHNAGQIVSYFERSFVDLLAEFGPTLTARGVDAIEQSWHLLHRLARFAGDEKSIRSCTGYLGIADPEKLRIFLESISARRRSGLITERVLLAEENDAHDLLPQSMRGEVSFVEKAKLLALLGTADERYIAAGVSQKGCTNSAVFTEKLVTTLLAQYPKRFRLIERTPVREIVLGTRGVRLITDNHTISAERVVLCTNGFAHFTIQNEKGAAIDPKFHDSLRGIIGYLSAQTYATAMPVAAVSYYPFPHSPDDTYFYVTKRHWGAAPFAKTLVCVGGGDEPLPKQMRYNPKAPFPEEKLAELQGFLQATFPPTPALQRYQWHGLMGYTQSGVRLIGAEPCNPALLYNLGCNGIGILPSVFGAFRIAAIIAGKRLRPSIFDPRDQRCETPRRSPNPALPFSKKFSTVSGRETSNA